MADDIATVPKWSANVHNARTARGCEDDQEERKEPSQLAENDPDSAATLSTTVSVQEADMRADAEESVNFAMRMCQDQTSCNKYFALVRPGWSRSEGWCT